MLLHRLIDYLDRLSKPMLVIQGLLAIALIGLVHLAAGWQFSLSVFYLLPVMLAAFHVGHRGGALLSAAAAAAWLAVDLLSSPPEPFAAAVGWNTVVRLLLFLVVTYLLAHVRGLLRQVRQLASIDPLTGLLNTREFYRRAHAELLRSRRYGRAFTVAYLDLDNFKAVNDTGGHTEGDRVLRMVAEVLQGSFRATDLVARLGGDEFAVLLVEAGEAAGRHWSGRASGCWRRCGRGAGR